jgi:hypothetical protein
MVIFRVIGYDGFFCAELIIEIEYSKWDSRRYILARNIITHESVLVDDKSIWYMMKG